MEILILLIEWLCVIYISFNIYLIYFNICVISVEFGVRNINDVGSLDKGY